MVRYEPEVGYGVVAALFNQRDAAPLSFPRGVAWCELPLPVEDGQYRWLFRVSAKGGPGFW